MYSKKIVFIAACIGMSVFGICLITLGSILPFLTQKFGLNEMEASFLVTILPFGILLGSLIFGPLSDRYGYKYLLIASTTIAILGVEILALGNSYILLLLSIMIIGTGGGVLNGLTNAMVSDISNKNKNSNLSLLGVFFGIGALGVPVVMGALSRKYSFENILILMGLLLGVFVLFFFLIKYPKPKQALGLPIKEVFKLLKEPTLILFSLVLFFESGLEGLTSNWTTTFLKQTTSLTPDRALFILTILMASMTLARLLLAWIMKKAKSEAVLYASICLTILGLLFLKSASSFLAVAVAISLLGVGFAAIFPLVLAYIGNIYAHLSGTAFSIALVIALLGNMFFNYLMGNLVKYVGIIQLTNVLLVSAIIMGTILSISIKKSRVVTHKLREN